MSALAAIAVDLIAGEPPTAMHPTVWMGRWLTQGRVSRRARRPAPSFVAGALVLGAGVAAAGAAAGLVDSALANLPPCAREPLRGLALKPAMSLRALLAAAAEVEVLLARGQLSSARRALGWHLVSRDTSTLSAGEVAGAAIESIAENLSDSVVAPLLAYRVGGLAGAYAYRMINTADAMLGYRTAELEWFGKPAARADDVANVIPARVTAFLICAAAAVGRGSARRGVRTALRDARRTTSPNAGWPMAAIAGVLNVRLTKRGVYVLNRSGRTPRPSDIARTRRIALAAATIAAAAVDCL